MRPFFRRLIPRLLLCLALGAISTIAIAWSLAPLPLTPLSQRLSLFLDIANPSANSILFTESHATGGHRYEWAPLTPLSGPTDLAPLLAQCRSIADQYDAHPPGTNPALQPGFLCRPHEWPRAAAVPRTTSSPRGRSTDLRGLPFPALSSSTTILASFYSGLGPPVSGGLALRKPTGDMSDTWTALPLRPLFPGFLLDAVIWSLPFLAAIQTYLALRTARRRRRGQCVHCGYSRAGLGPETPCPECGRVARASLPVSDLP